LSINNPGTIYLLWGEHAKKYQSKIDPEENVIMTTPNTPYEKEWLGHGHFSITNSCLKKMREEIIKW
jgi:uracil DNA glycosylase